MEELQVAMTKLVELQFEHQKQLSDRQQRTEEFLQ